MRRIKLSFVIVMIALLLSSCSAGKDEIVATVGKEKITSKELMLVMVEAYENPNEILNIDSEKIKEESYRNLVEQTLILLDAKENGIKVSNDEIKARMESLYSKEKITNLKKEYGITEETLKKVVEKRIFYQKYIMDVLGKDKGYHPTEEQVLDLFYNSYYKIQQILISSDSMDENKKNAERIYERINEETDFNELALNYSEDTGLISKPGEYVVFRDSEMEEWLFDVVSSLSIGEVSEPYKSSYGYHIIKRMPLYNEDIRDKQAEIINEYKTEYFNKQIKNLEDKYKIIKNDDKLKQIAVSAGF